MTALEAGEQGDAAGDEEAAHEHGAGDSPEEDFGLVGGIDLEEAEEEQEDEEVVDGERLFERVAGEVLGRDWLPDGAEEKSGKGERRGDPEAGGGDSGGVGSSTDPVSARRSAPSRGESGRRRENRSNG